MKLTLWYLLLAFSGCVQLGCVHKPERPIVPADFSYPAVGQNVELSEPLTASRVSGKVLDPNGDPVNRALVEVTTADWSQRVSATFTDESGYFDFSSLGPGEYPIRVTKPGFAPLLGKIRVSKSGPKSVNLNLHVAT